MLDDDGSAAAHWLLWFDPVTATGLVEPMRTEDAHQRPGLGRHVLTSGIDRLIGAGADRIKIASRLDDPAGRTLYTSVGSRSIRPCAMVSLLSQRTCPPATRPAHRRVESQLA